MSITTTGSEFKRFYKDRSFWPEDQGDTWHDQERITADGDLLTNEELPRMPDTAVVVLDGGVVHGPALPDGGVCLEEYFRQWLARQSTRRLVVECPSSALDTIIVAVEAAGGTVLRP